MFSQPRSCNDLVCLSLPISNLHTQAFLSMRGNTVLNAANVLCPKSLRWTVYTSKLHLSVDQNKDGIPSQASDRAVAALKQL